MSVNDREWYNRVDDVGARVLHFCRDGFRSHAEILEAISRWFPGEEIHRAIDRLKADGKLEHKYGHRDSLYKTKTPDGL